MKTIFVTLIFLSLTAFCDNLYLPEVRGEIKNAPLLEKHRVEIQVSWKCYKPAYFHPAGYVPVKGFDSEKTFTVNSDGTFNLNEIKQRGPKLGLGSEFFNVSVSILVDQKPVFSEYMGKGFQNRPLDNYPDYMNVLSSKASKL